MLKGTQNFAFVHLTGLLFTEFLNEFGAGEVVTSWLTGIMFGLFEITGMFICLFNSITPL